MKRLLTIFCLLLAAAIIDVNPCEAVRPSRGGLSPLKAAKKPACPVRIRQATKMGLTDAAKFKKSHPSWLWSSFLLKTRPINKDCPSYVRKAYLESARKGFRETPPSRFYRP